MAFSAPSRLTTSSTVPLEWSSARRTSSAQVILAPLMVRISSPAWIPASLALGVASSKAATVTVPEDKSRPTTFPTGTRYSDANTPVVNIQMKTMAMIKRLVNFFMFQPSFSSVPLIWLSECFVNAEIAEKSGKTFIAKFCHLL